MEGAPSTSTEQQCSIRQHDGVRVVGRRGEGDGGWGSASPPRLTDIQPSNATQKTNPAPHSAAHAIAAQCSFATGMLSALEPSVPALLRGASLMLPLHRAVARLPTAAARVSLRRASDGPVLLAGSVKVGGGVVCPPLSVCVGLALFPHDGRTAVDLTSALLPAIALRRCSTRC